LTVCDTQLNLIEHLIKALKGGEAFMPVLQKVLGHIAGLAYQSLL
jgi:hypothetical protein